MTFDVDAAAYDAFMGRYSVLLAPQLADLAGVSAGQRALDVGCGTGTLTGELVSRLGASSVSAADPSAPFIESMRDRYPEVDVRLAPAELLPFPDDSFDVALAQLVVLFMSDPVAGLAEMARVTRLDGVVAACVWDHAAGGQGPLSVFWKAARDIDPNVDDESTLAGAGQGQLTELFTTAGLRQVEEVTLSIGVEHSSFEEWWEPYTLGVGPAGAHVASLSEEGLAELRDHCRRSLPEAPFVLTARAWAARGLVETR
jgi:SAM-dependent methyltransferase